MMGPGSNKNGKHLRHLPLREGWISPAVKLFYQKKKNRCFLVQNHCFKPSLVYFLYGNERHIAGVASIVVFFRFMAEILLQASPNFLANIQFLGISLSIQSINKCPDQRSLRFESKKCPFPRIYPFHRTTGPTILSSLKISLVSSSFRAAVVPMLIPSAMWTSFIPSYKRSCSFGLSGSGH